MSVICLQLNDQTVLFSTIRFSISHLFAFSLNVKHFYLTHRLNLSDATTLSQCGPGSDGTDGVVHLAQTPALLEPHHQTV